MGEVEEAAQGIADRPGPAAPRLRELMKTVHRMNSERYVGDSKLHEMVAIAMEEDWEVCNAHIMLITRTMGSVIAQGVASGEFEVADLEQAALCCCTGMLRFFHPQMIAQCANKPGPTIDQMIDFIFAEHGATGQSGALGYCSSIASSGRAKRASRRCPTHSLCFARGSWMLVARSCMLRCRGHALRPLQGKITWTPKPRKTCIPTSRPTATASSTIPSTPSSRRARSAGSRRGMPRATSISRPTASSTPSTTTRRSSASPRPPGRTASRTSRRPASSSGISRPWIWRSR